MKKHNKYAYVTITGLYTGSAAFATVHNTPQGGGAIKDLGGSLMVPHHPSL